MPRAKPYHAHVNAQTYEAEVDTKTIKINQSLVEGSLKPTGLNSYSLLLNGTSYDMHIHTDKLGSYSVTIRGTTIDVEVKNQRELLLQQFGINNTSNSHQKEVRAPMPGLVLSVLVTEGQEVEKGTGLVILEAMKMENEIKAPAKGIIKKVCVQPGIAISKNDLLIEL